MSSATPTALHRFVCVAALSALNGALPSPVAALASRAATSPRAHVTLVSEMDAVTPGEQVRLGLRQRLSPHWHTYWKNPGDAGTAPTLEWTLPAGAEASAIAWPAPVRLPAGPVVSFGYEDEVLLPVTVQVPAAVRPGTAFVVEADASWLVCREECIPEDGHFRLALPVVAKGEAAPKASAEVSDAFAWAKSRQPRPVGEGAATLALEGDALSLQLPTDALPADIDVDGVFFFPADWGLVEHAGPQRASLDPSGLSLAMPKGAAFTEASTLAGVLAVPHAAEDGVVTWLEVPATPVSQRHARGPGTEASEAGPTAAPAEAPAALALPLWQAALFALLGGLLLNLMPCVLPVLAIKAHGLLKLGRGDRASVRGEALWYTAGVVTAFVGLAGALLLVRQGGEAVGWGFQFQSSTFVLVMSWLMLALGLNLSGTYELGLGLQGVGDAWTQKPGWAGSFFTGVLAVVVATPCSAPFMGAALGAALLAPPLTCLALFATLGLGLALPYAAIGLFPSLAARLPRPGAWMERLKQALAFAMYGTAAWLLWVLSRQGGDSALRVGLAGAVLTGLACWSFGWSQAVARRKYVPALLGAAALATAVALGFALEPPDDAPAAVAGAEAGEGRTEAFTPERLAQLRRDSTPVLVNLTADWCITCLVNERSTLSSQAVGDALEGAGAVYLKGDWTQRDPAITAYLQSFERDGVPFYAVYPASGGEPEVLSSVLTVSAVTDALKRAAPPRP